MNNKQKFENFLESLKGNGQDKLVESVKQGFQTCFEAYRPDPEETKRIQGEILEKQTSFRGRLEDFSAHALSDFIHEMNNEYTREMHPNMRNAQNKLSEAYGEIATMLGDWGSKYV